MSLIVSLSSSFWSFLNCELITGYLYFPAPGPGPQFVFTGPGPRFVFTGPGPQSVFTGPGPQFVFVDPGQSVAWACIYQPCPPNLYLLALVYDFYYRALNLHLTSYL